MTYVDRDTLASYPYALNELMPFDHVVEITADGYVRDAAGVYAPDCHLDGGEFQLDCKWELLTGFTGQYGSKSGAGMHSSEFIGGRLAWHLLDTPGVYVALNPYDMEHDEPSDEWVIARLIDSGCDCGADQD